MSDKRGRGSLQRRTKQDLKDEPDRWLDSPSLDRRSRFDVKAETRVGPQVTSLCD